MPDSDNREAELPLLGIDFVFDMGMKKIEGQMKNIEALDLKIAVLFGFLGTVLVALLALVFVAERSVAMTLIGWPGRIFLLLGVTFTGLAIVNTFEAFWPRLYYGTPRFLDMFRWANEDPGARSWCFSIPYLTHSTETFTDWNISSFMQGVQLGGCF